MAKIDFTLGVITWIDLREVRGTKMSDMSPNVIQDVTEAKDEKSLDERILEAGIVDIGKFLKINEIKSQ